MPRRPVKRSSGKLKPRALNRSEGKIERWNKSSDIPLEEEDQFHASRDKILLEGEEFDYENDDGEDEVFELKGFEESDSGDEPENDNDVSEGEDNWEDAAPMKKVSKVKLMKSTAPSSSSEGSTSEEETWGPSKSAYYSSNAAQLESDDEEANELEEQEAKRLQAKARDGLLEEDFGVGDVVGGGDKRNEDLEDLYTVVTQPLPLDKRSIIRHLERNDPESLALARDWEDTAISLINTQQRLAKLEAEVPDVLSLGMIHLHYQALLTYATTLSFYLYLRASEKYAQRPDLLKSHPVLDRLLTLKQSLSTLEELDFALSDAEEDDEDGFGMFCEEDDIVMDAEQLWKFDQRKGLETDELNELLEDAKSFQELPITSILEREGKPAKKKRKTISSDSSTPPIFDLVEPTFQSSKPSSASHNSLTSDAYGEATSLQHADAADKTTRKKSLRFHTSKIENASVRRQGARSKAVGGDDDLPYRERRQEKEARLVKEAKTRGLGGEDLDVNPGLASVERKRRRGEEGTESECDEEETDGYYELVKRTSKEKREQKKTDYEAAQAASRLDFNSTADASNGPRSLTRAILANKGLTPHRPKSVRNPRVKKRQKFEKAKKKVSSQKAVYKGGVSVERYEGEKSGISNVVKSVKLG